MAKNLRWKVLVILGVIALSVFAFYPPEQKVRLGLDLKGGVHLVMRVQTDDALRLETETTTDRLREQMKTADIPGTVAIDSPTEFTVSGRPAGPGRGVPAAADRRRADLHPVVRRRQLHLHDAAEHRGAAARGDGRAGAADNRAPRQRARRRRADRRAPQRRGPDPGAAARASPTSPAPRRSSGPRRILELKLVEQGPFSDEAAGAPGLRQQRAARHADPAGQQRQPAAAAGRRRCYYVVRRVLGGHRPRSAQRAPVARREQPAGGGLHAQQRGRPQVRRLHRGEHRQASWPSCSTAACTRRRASTAASTTRAASTGSFTQQEAADLSLVLRSGALPATLTYLEERTVGPSLGADSIRAGVTGLDRRPGGS